jgi:hypothetical protein
MARRSIVERIAQLEARKKALQARLSKQERAVDTRRKVLLGALVLQRLETSNDPEFTRRLSDWLKRELPGFLIRENDRALFPEFIDQKPGSAGNVTAAVPGGDAHDPASGNHRSAASEAPAHPVLAGDLR